MIFYIADTTVNPQREVRFDNYKDTVNYLSGMSKRAYGQDRKARMLMLEEIGYGADDGNAVTFVRSMAEKFDIGIIRDKIRHVRCDISTIPLYQKEEFGN